MGRWDLGGSHRHCTKRLSLRPRPLINSFDGPGGTKGQGSRQQQGGGVRSYESEGKPSRAWRDEDKSVVRHRSIGSAWGAVSEDRMSGEWVSHGRLARARHCSFPIHPAASLQCFSLLGNASPSHLTLTQQLPHTPGIASPTQPESLPDTPGIGCPHTRLLAARCLVRVMPALPAPVSLSVICLSTAYYTALVCYLLQHLLQYDCIAIYTVVLTNTEPLYFNA